MNDNTIDCRLYHDSCIQIIYGEILLNKNFSNLNAFY